MQAFAQYNLTPNMGPSVSIRHTSSTTVTSM